MRTTIVSGVCIGSNVFIGAGSLVTKAIPDNRRAVGSPARIVP
jgi:acetyltransferase-like isoleucine patch superfamily enzyme